MFAKCSVYTIALRLWFKDQNTKRVVVTKAVDGVNAKLQAFKIWQEPVLL